MAIAVVFEFPTQSVDQYEKVFDIGGDPILSQPERLSHACYVTPGGFTVVDVWTSEEAFGAFGDVIGPVMGQLGLEAEPKIYPAQGVVTRDGARTL